MSFVICFYFSQTIFEFLAKPLTSILKDGNGLIYTALQEAFLTNVKVAFFTAAFISFPFLSFQIWSFIAPGLLKKEKQVSLPTLVAIPFLFILGAAVVYYVISPIAWKFFLSFQTAQADGINITLQAKMNELKVLLSKLSRSDQIKSYLNKIKDSLVLIKRCVVIIVFLAGLMVFLREYI